jgi:serine protease Do
VNTIHTITSALVVSVAMVVTLGVGPDPAAAQNGPPPSFATVVEAVAPAVVTIVPPGRGDTPRSDADDEADSDGDAAIGSGVIIDPRGVVVTNAHVARASAIEVVTPDGRRHRPSRVAIDARSNLAVLVIGNGRESFASARLGDSDGVRIGDWVIAIGAPLGLQTTVTAGVVSARPPDSMGLDAPDYLLTTAVMRAGSTGGPLVNARGEIVGINTIFALETAGIAFTIPSNTARSIVPQLLKTGRVSRASLGLITQGLTPELADALKTRASTGLLVADVVPNGPAAAAGIKPGDLLLAFDTHPLIARTDLPRALQHARPGQDVALRIRRRDGSEATVSIRLTQERSEAATSLITYRLPELGCEVRSLTPDAGIVVSRVERSGEGTGLRAGDIVREVNHVPVRTIGQFARVADRLRAGETVALLVQRGRVSVYVALTAGSGQAVTR